MALRLVRDEGEPEDRVTVDWKLLWPAAAMAALLFTLVTARWERPGQSTLYGFPLPFLWGESVDPLALTVDVLVYFAAAVGLCLVLRGLLPRPRSVGLRIAMRGCRALLLVVGVLLVARGLVGLGSLAPRTAPPMAFAEKSLWWGPPASD